MTRHLKAIIVSGLWAACSSGTSQAQKLNVEAARLTVSPNTVLTVKGSIENTGTIVNNGQMNVSGFWINTGVYNPGRGGITFNSPAGNVPQIIHHNGQPVSRVTISGGSKKVMLSDMIITQQLNFGDGVLETSGDSKIIFAKGTVISGASDRSHIHGAVYHRGQGMKLFPIGNGTSYLPVELLNVEDAEALIGVRAFEFQNLTLSKTFSLNAISNKRYWHIDIVSGTLKNSRIILPLRGESWAGNPEKIVVAQSTSPAENFNSIGQSLFQGVGSYDRVTSDQVVSLPFVTLASTAEDASIVIYNAVSPNEDGLNDFLRILNIEHYPDNKFTIFNRWGDKIFEIENYNNEERAFRGKSDLHGGKDLVSGTYFYVLDLKNAPSVKGFLNLKQ